MELFMCSTIIVLFDYGQLREALQVVWVDGNH